MRRLALALALASLAAACGTLSGVGAPGASGRATPVVSFTVSGSAVASATAIVVGTIVPGSTGPSLSTPPPPTPTPSPAPGGLTQAQLKYQVINQFGHLFFCDPDFYPVARRDEQTAADERFPEIARDAPSFSAILLHLGIAPSATYTAAERLEIDRDWKMLNALRLEPQGGSFHFNAIFGASAGGQQGLRVDGTIDAFGQISVASRTPSRPPPCPICLARGTFIATPSGDVAVEELRIGDTVWTLDGRGLRVEAPVTLVGMTTVPPTHEVLRIALDDGRVVFVSSGHPTADGRRVGDLVSGSSLDGGRVVSVKSVGYDGGATFDLLPAGPTGTYWANGVRLASTLRYVQATPLSGTP